MKAFDCTGFWWLPDQPELQAAGTLHVSSAGDLKLSLIGSLGDKEEGERGKSHRLILGSVDGAPRGNDVTLLGCTRMGSSIGSYVGVREEYSAGRAFFGGQLGDDDLKFRSVLLKISGLSEWADSLSGLRHGKSRMPISRDAGKMVPVAEYLVPTSPSGRISEAKVTLNIGVGTHSRAQVFEIHEEANILVEFDRELTLGEIEGRYVYAIQNLLTFSTERPQVVESISVWRGEDLGDWENNPEIRVVGARVQPDEDSERDSRSDEMLVTLADVDFAPFIGRWLDMAKRYSDAFNIYFGSLYGPPAYIDMTFTLVAQSVALYYTRTDEGTKHREEEAGRLKHVIRALPGPDADWLLSHLGVSPHPSFQSLLQRLVDRYGVIIDPLISSRRDAFVNQCAATLRYIEGREPEERGAAAHGSALYWLIQKLRLLLKCCLLSELQFKQDQISSMVMRNPYFHHIGSLEAKGSKATPTNNEIDIAFKFAIPTDAVLDKALGMSGSADTDEQLVGKAVVELTEITRKTKAAVEDVASEERYDLSVYFDYNLTESLEAAKRLQSLTEKDKDTRHVARTLIGQAEAVANSKMAFMKATRPGRLSSESLRPVPEWAFPIPRETSVDVAGTQPPGQPFKIVMRHSDGEWQFLTGAAAVGFGLKPLSELIAADPTLLEVADLPLGHKAERHAVGGPWHRAPI